VFLTYFWYSRLFLGSPRRGGVRAGMIYVDVRVGLRRWSRSAPVTAGIRSSVTGADTENFVGHRRERTAVREEGDHHRADPTCVWLAVKHVGQKSSSDFHV